MEQLAPAASVLPQLLMVANELGLTPPRAMPVMFSVAVPGFDNVTTCGPLVPPVVWLPKDTLDGDKTACGATPVPESAAVWGDPVALSLTEIAAVSVPDTAGTKVTDRLQLAPAARVEPHPLFKLNDDAFGPVTLMLLIFSVAWPGLDNDRTCAVLGCPTN